jgi:hypothetical protein
MKNYVVYYMASQSSLRVSSAPTTSGMTVDAIISPFFTYPSLLQTPRHIEARVDCTESWLLTCERSSLP